MRILVAQMTRMGDTLQTSPLVQSLRCKYPQAHIALMVRRLGETIAKNQPGIDEVIVYDEDQMFLDLRSQDSDRLLRAYDTAEALIQRLREAHFDLVFNCTHSIASAMLLKLAECPNVVGAHLSDDWQFILRGGWTNYFFTSCLCREYNDINICDTFQRFLPDGVLCQELTFGISEQDRLDAAALLEANGIASNVTTFCFQLGASDNAKRWPAERFAELAKLLVKRYPSRILLLGVQEESGFGQEFERHAPGLALHLFGQTSLGQLAAILERSTALVTNDTGTMHMAAAAKCPVILVSVGYVHFRETGPYGEGHCAVEERRADVGRTDLLRVAGAAQCRIRAGHVLLALEHALGKTVNADINAAELEDVDVHISQFAPDGCLVWSPIVKRPLTKTDVLRIAYRAMWLEFLQAAHQDAVSASLSAYLQHHSPTPELDTWIEDLCRAFDGLASIAQEGTAQSAALIDSLTGKRDLRAAQELVGRLVQLDDQIRLHGEMYTACRPLALIARFERDNLEGADPLALAETTQRIYADLAQRAGLMNQKLRHIAGLVATDTP